VKKIIYHDLIFSLELVHSFDDKWLIWSKKDQLEKLVLEMSKIQTLIEKTRLRKEEQQEKVNAIKDVDLDQKIHDTKQKEKENLKKEYASKRQEAFSDFFNRKYSWYNNPPPNEEKPQQTNKLKSPDQILIEYGIRNKKEWKDWLRKNHPDRGGDKEDCQKVITAGKELNY